MIEAITHLRQRIRHHVASGGGTIGMCPAAEARFQIRIGCSGRMWNRPQLTPHTVEVRVHSD